MTKRELQNLLTSVAATLDEVHATLSAAIRASEDRVWEAAARAERAEDASVRPASDPTCERRVAARPRSVA